MNDGKYRLFLLEQASVREGQLIVCGRKPVSYGQLPPRDEPAGESLHSLIGPRLLTVLATEGVELKRSI